MILLFMLSFVSAAEQERVRATVTYRIPEGIYVNSGTAAGLHQGISGSLMLESGRVFVFDVIQASRSSALLRLKGDASGLVGSLRNQPVELVFDRSEEPVADEGTASSDPSEDEPFVPLLAPPQATPDVAPTANISHGRVGVQQTLLGATDNQQDYAVTRLDTSGSIDRLFGTQWSFIWSGNLRYRTGDGYENHPEFETIQPLIYSSYFQVPLSGDGFARLGRFLPLELPSIGYLDGGQVEVDFGNNWAWGFSGGLKPNRVNLEWTGDEPTAALYGTFKAGTVGSTYFSGTAGLLGSVYKGEVDRLAMLFDQRAGFGPKLDIFSSAELDFGVANTTNSQTQLSRFDIYASSRLHSLLTLRAGTDHWQRLDSEAERDLLPFIVSDQLFDDGYWRYWVGASHELPWKLDLNEEVAYTVSDATDDAVRWRIGLTRTGLFKWKFANFGATLYNLEAQNADGLGWLLRAYLPLWDGKVSLRPSASARWLDPSDGSDGLALTYLALYGDWLIFNHWTITGGATLTAGDAADSVLFDLGLRYRW